MVFSVIKVTFLLSVCIYHHDYETVSRKIKATSQILADGSCLFGDCLGLDVPAELQYEAILVITDEQSAGPHCLVYKLHSNTV